MKKLFPAITALLAIALATVSGCGKSDSSTSSSGNSGSSAASAVSAPGFTGVAAANPLEGEAQNAALAEIQKHMIKGPNGWTTERISGSAYAPDHFLRQIREIDIDAINANPVSDADKLNGVEWSGTITFKQLAAREAGDAGMLLDGLGNPTGSRQKGQWSVWSEYTPEWMQLQKQNGKWVVDDDTWLLRGTIPTPADYAYAGVQP
jgi:hypothetical protein